MNFKSPLCSCLVCHEVKSSKGIFTHYFAKHDLDGIKIMAEIRKKGTDCTFRNSDYIKQNSQKRIKPKKQKSCANDKCSNLTTSKFCSSSCAAIVNNRLRPSKKSLSRVKQIKQTRTDKLVVMSKIKKRTCSECGKIDETLGRFQSDKCSFCNDSLVYRRQCEFKFNLKDFPNEFDFKLLNEHGMFSPKKNPKGVSRDHMLSIQYGKINRISPDVIGHPANCRLILQGDNTKKQADSCITYEELLNRIKEWDNKYRLRNPDSNQDNALDVSGL